MTSARPAHDATRCQGRGLNAGGTRHEQRLGRADAERSDNGQHDVSEGPGEDAVGCTQHQCGRDSPGERGEETHSQRGTQATARDPGNHRGERTGGHKQECRERSGGDSQRRDGCAQECQHDREGVRSARISVATRHPRGPRGIPQLGPGRGHGHPRSTDEASRGPPPLGGGKQRGHESEAETGGCGTDAVAPHRGDDERINALPMLVFIDTGRFLAQRGGSRLEGAQGRAGNSTRMGGAGTTGKEARSRADERDERSHFR